MLKYIFGILLVISSLLLKAQTASFTMSQDEGCGSLVVHFTNTSQTTGDVLYQWTFGNGSQSVEENPSITYLTSGIYIVTLVITDDNGSDLLSDQVTVHPFPNVNFTATNTAGCSPLTTSFTDLSTSGDAAIVDWAWNFGNGTVSSEQNPVRTYSNPGQYSVTLSVEDALGCENHIVMHDFVNVSSPPNAAFTPSLTYNCVPSNIQFTNSSTGTALPLSYNWNFGDGGSSGQQNPSHFFQDGNHTITLTVSDNFSCTDQASQLIIINEQDPEIVISPASLCQGEPVYFQNSESTTSVWNFGDNSATVSGVGVNHTFDQPGVYTVALTSGTGICQRQVSEVITVYPSPNTHFTYPGLICQAGDVIISNSLNEANNTWNVYLNHMTQNDFISSSQSLDLTNYFAFEQNYIISLTTTDSHSCTSTFIDTITPIFTKFDTVTVTPHNSCIPFVTDIIPSISTADPIVSYEWTLNGVPYSTLPALNNLLIDTVGDYEFFLTVTTALGCQTSASIDISAGIEYPIEIIPLNDTICVLDTAFATIIGLDTAETYTYIWVVGASGSSGDTIHTGIVDHMVGLATIYTDVAHYGCNSIAWSEVFVKGPFIKDLTETVVCGDLLSREFVADAYDYQTLLWNFNDLSTPEYGTENITHDYPSFGTYLLELTAHNDTTGCPDFVYQDSIVITTPYLTANVQDVSCMAANIFIEETNYIDLIKFSFGPDPSDNFGWFHDTIYSFNYDYYTPGLKEFYIITTDAYGCIDSVKYEITIAGVDFDFSVIETNICFGDSIYVDDMSTGIFPLNHWSWYMDDSNFSNTSEDTIVPYKPNYGSHYIWLTVRDTNNCFFVSDSIPIEVNNITTTVHPEDNLLCLGDELVLEFNNMQTNLQFENYYGDSTAIVSDFYHTYSDTGTYSVEVMMTDDIGCIQKYTLDGISVQTANAIISLEEDTFQCYPETPVFIHADTLEPPYYEYEWSDNASHLAFIPNPIFVYPERGEYYVTVTVTSSNGCTDSDILGLVIDGPDADIFLSDDIICINDTVTFKMINDTNIVGFQWTLGDGFGASNMDSIGHVFSFVPDSESFEVVLTFPAFGCDADGDGQDDEYTVVEYINIFPVESRFQTFNALTGDLDTNSCLPFPISFINNSLGNNQYDWILGDGSIDSVLNVLHVYDSIDVLVDTLEVKLLLESQQGCRDTSSQLIILRSVPPISITDEQFICYGDTLTLNVSGGVKVLWNSTSIINEPDSFQINVNPNETDYFHALITESNLCTNEDSVLVKVQQIPTLFSSFEDTTVVVGTDFDLHILSDHTDLTYEWFPTDGLSCSDCPNPEVHIEDPMEYTITIRDSANCHTVSKDLMIDVFYAYTIDVPNTFTPNGDGVNDIVFVNGWGLKELIEFKIYNRWGEQVFFTNDFNVGWDGKLNGVDQNMDTYVFVAKAVSYAGFFIDTKGTITLLR